MILFDGLSNVFYINIFQWISTSFRCSQDQKAWPAQMQMSISTYLVKGGHRHTGIDKVTKYQQIWERKGM